jgi:hypothetical protein
MDVGALLFFLKLVVPNINPMKKQLLLLFVVLSVLKINSQVVFCPPGAEWHYKFGNNLPYYPINENIKYIGDSVISGETTKVLRHSKFYNSTNDNYGIIYTFLKQHGDTVFFKNAITQNQWQILYNFNTPINHGWDNYISLAPGASAKFLFSTLVDSIKVITINNTSIKQMYVTNVSHRYQDVFITNGIIAERFGSLTDYLFNFSNYAHGTDADYFGEILCYRDNTIGLKQFSAQSCLTGLESRKTKENNLQVFPNPCSDNLKLSLETQNTSSNYEMRLMNALGEEIFFSKIHFDLTEIFWVDISSFKSGLYLVQLFENKKLIETQKVIKE